MPPPLIRALRCFYVNNVHTMKLKGRRFPSITSQSGIRQGCPLSPLLFAIVVDLFLRRLDTLFPHECTRAFADDIAMVLHNFDSSADLLITEFRKFGDISGLHLGMSKTILIPLWTFDERSFKGFLRDTFPAWSTAQVKTCGKYLGFMLGPGKRDSSWTDVLEKYRSRSVVWSGPPVGLFRATQIYKTLVCSVLAFVCQLEEPPEAAILLESICMRKFALGPGNWISTLDLFHLQDLFGLPVSFPSIRTYALASKLRVARFEIGDIHAKSRELTALLSNTVVKPVPHDWYERSCIRLLAAAVSQAEALRVTHASITQALKAKTSLSGAKLSAFIRIHYQKEAYKQLLSKGCDGLDVERRHRHRQSRWALQAYPGISARWAASLFRRLASLVRPRVISSIARTHWNAWCTSRRFQQEGTCRFLCSPSACDSIEHYMFCPVFVSLATEILHLPKFDSMQDFLLLNHRLWDDGRLAVSAIAVHALYTAFNQARQGPFACPSDTVDFMERCCRHQVLGHQKSKAFLASALQNGCRR